MSSSAESLTTATPPSKKRRVESSEATGNLLKGIVNWSGVAWKAHISHFDNTFSNNLSLFQVLQTMLAMYGFH